MRIFITGANGQLAKSFVELLPDVEIHLATKKSLDVTNRRQVRKQIKEFNPDIVFHFASLTRGDECAKDPKLANKINVRGTENVVVACSDVDAAIVFVSTNEVFDGGKGEPYQETDSQNPITVAGKTKYKAEQAIMQGMKKYFIVRTSWLFSKWSANFLQVVLTKATKNKKVQLVEDEVSSPTYSVDLAKAILDLIKTKKYGIYHLVNEGIVSRLEFAKKAFEINGIKDVIINPVKLSDFARLSKPPLFSPLKNTKGAKLHIVLPHWEDALTRFFKEHKII